MRIYLVWGILLYLRFFAKIALLLHRPFVIGIAGSVGKSSTRNAFHAVLKEHKTTKVVTGNSETGVPLGILGLTVEGYTPKDWLKVMLKAPTHLHSLAKVDYLIIEMGIDDPYPPKNMGYLLSIVKPDLAVSLNISATHTMQFEKLLRGKKVKNPTEFLLERIAREDTKIITSSHCKIGVYNKDDAHITSQIEKFAKKKTHTKLVSFGKGKENDVSYSGYEVTTKKCKFTFTVNTTRGEKELELAFNQFLLPQAYQESLAAVIAACVNMNIGITLLKESIEKNFKLPKSRASIFEGINDSMIIDSTYNSSKSSVLTFLDLVKKLKDKTDRPVIFIMGDMRELGEQAEAEHTQVAQKLSGIVDYLYTVGPLTAQYVIPTVKELMSSRKKTSLKVADSFKSALQLALHVKSEIPKNAIILVKGSQNEIFLEEAVKFLLQNPADAKNVCRQDEYWSRTKATYFNLEAPTS